MNTQIALLWALFVEGLMIFWQLLKIRNGLNKSMGQAQGSVDKKEAA
ncbi:MAG TPA: hypothetical protein VMX16_17010 [Terriglobia bacterium]|nr:hypothetical protein [Terriglobia bacterium]